MEQLANMGINGLLIAVILVVLISGYLGYRKGVIKMLYKLFAVILAIVLTIILSPITKGILMKNDKVYSIVSQKVEEFVDFTGIKTSFEGKDEVMHDSENDGTTAIGSIKEMLLGLGLPEAMVESVLGDDSFVGGLESNADQDINSRIEGIEQSVYVGITGTIIKALAFLITLAIVAIILFILGFVFDFISELPVIENINELVGALAGGAIGIVLVWVFFTIVTVVSTTEFGQLMLALIKENPILTFIYENNIISRKIFN